MYNGFNMKNHVSIEAKFQGQYRYRLIGPDGEIKEQCNWKPNLLLDQGLDLLRTAGIGNNMAIGTGTTPATIADVGLEGTHLATDAMAGLSHNATPTGPNWERWTVKQALYGVGVGIGTVGEFVIGATDVGTQPKATIRVVLDTPIVKGSLDQLIIEHKITYWPYIGPDITDVINISGVAYNVTMRLYYGANNSNQLYIVSFSNAGTWGWYAYSNGELPVDMDVGVGGGYAGTSEGWVSAVNKTYGGTPPNYWVNGELVYGIDLSLIHI